MIDEFVPLDGVHYKYDYQAIFAEILAGKLDGLATYRQLCLEDLFFLLYFGLEQTYINKPFVVAACQEVEDDHDDTLDLWAREHYKSTLLTYGLVIQEIISDPEVRICIFSHTRPIAKGFLRQIKLTLEDHPPAMRWFSEIFWAKPKTQAPKWSEDDGLIVKRRGKGKEATVEAWGLVDGQPTSKHFSVRVYDDVVTKESVTTPEMIKKTLDSYELSQSLGTDGGSKRVIGTHYHFSDLYTTLIAKGGYLVRKKPATDDGTASGNPVLLSEKRLVELRHEQGGYVFACQQLLNPVAGENQTFLAGWIHHYETLPGRLNKYLIVDPANEKTKKSDYTVMAVIGVDAHENYYLLDLLRDRLNLTERWEALRDMWKRNSGILRVGYERYGIQADVSYFKERQKKEGVYFQIVELGGNMSKIDRIQRLVPLFEFERFFLPPRLLYKNRDMVSVFINEELLFFPYATHDDLLDCLARIRDDGMRVRAPSAKAGARQKKSRNMDYDEFSDAA